MNGVNMTNESNLPADSNKPTTNPIDPTGGSATPSPASTGSRTPRQIASATLLQGEREIQIVHGEEVYRLSLTRQGKLILHK